jgi:5,10-methylenetetrahydromethanopterin reductase
VNNKIGMVFGSLTPPEDLAEGAALAEQLGFGEVWFSEDCFFTGGMSGLTQLLASTRQIPAGLGLASVVTRHPAVLAMELAGLARMHPGRSRAAIGLGNRFWLEQMGVMPQRPLTAVTETFDVLRDLLNGEKVSRQAGPHKYDAIELAFPPKQPPELWIGAVNERALKAAGSRADGVLLSVLSGPSYLRWAKEQVAAGAQAANRPVPPITAFVLASVADDDETARDAVRDAVTFFVDAESHTALIGQSDRSADPLDEFAVAGTPERVAAGLRRLLDSGADSLGLWLFPAEQLTTQLHRIATEVFPLLD